MAKTTIAHQYGLTLGATLGLIHLGWALLVALELAKPLMDFILKVHMIQISLAILPFTLEAAAVLVVITTISGYVLGYILGAVQTYVQKRT